MNDLYYRLGDGRIYSVAGMDFVSGYTGEAIAVPGGTVAALKKLLDFYRLPIGSCLLDVEEKRQLALAALQEVFDHACESVRLELADGFAYDANETALRNIQGLLVTLPEGEEAAFCGADNSFRNVSRQELVAMQKAIILHGQKLYQTKWQIRSAISQAQTAEELDAVSFEALAPQRTD